MLNSFVASESAFLFSSLSRAGHEMPAHALRGGSPSTGMKTTISSSRSESRGANASIAAAGAFITSAAFAAAAACKTGPGQKAGNMRFIRAAATTLNYSSTQRKPIVSRKLRVAVIGGGPCGARAAETLAKVGIETFLIEQKLDNCKMCGGTIPQCMLDEFDLPKDIVDRQARKMTMISQTKKEVQIGQTLKNDEFIGMVRREVMDKYVRDRAAKNGAMLINGLMLSTKQPEQPDGCYVITYNDFGNQEGTTRKGLKTTLEAYMVLGADGANSRVAKEIGAGDYEYAIAFQERMRIPEEKEMEYYEERAEMYVGEDVYPDFYGWVFPKCDHVAVGAMSFCKGLEFMD